MPVFPSPPIRASFAGAVRQASETITRARLDRYFTLIAEEAKHGLAANRRGARRPDVPLFTFPDPGGFTKIQRLTIPGPAGELESLLEFDPEREPRMTAVVCHPHPLYGGTMHNKVVFRAARAAREAGLPTLRFHFRGVGASQGTHDKGIGERDDVRAALDFLNVRFPGLPVCLMGFSFGSWVGLRVGAEDARVAALVGLGLPTIDSDYSYLHGVTKPKLIVQGTRDQYGRREDVQAVFDSLPDPKQIHWVEGAQHFFLGRLEEVRDAIHNFLLEIVPRYS
jgi:alpha/beta superfamily hydrolase